MIPAVSRLLSTLVLVLFGVSVIVFLLLQLSPGDVTVALLGPQASAEAREALRLELGLNDPLPIQYWRWLSALLSGDFGTSITSHRAVLDLIVPRFWNTLILAAASLLIAVSVGFFVGLRAAAKPGSWFDRISVSLVMVLGNTPPFWLGLVLVLIFALNLRLLPATGMVSMSKGGGLLDILWHLVLPAIATAVAPAAVITRMVRATLLEVLSQDYIQVARAKGVPRRTLLRRHALRNALPPITTIVGLQLGYLLGGALFTEVVFAWPGLGQQLFTAITARDVPVVQGAVLLIAFLFVVVNMAADLLNRLIDPRTRHG